MGGGRWEYLFSGLSRIPAGLAVAVFLYLQLQLLRAPLQTLTFSPKGDNGLGLIEAPTPLKYPFINAAT